MPKKICGVCEKETGNLTMHMRVHNNPPVGNGQSSSPIGEVPLQSSPNEPQFATRSEVSALTDIVSKLVDKLDKKGDPVAALVESKDDHEAAPIDTHVPPEWRKLVDEILGTEFGINVSYPNNGSGFLFKVVVPESKSNMNQAYREMYKVDVRTKAVPYSEGVEGIRKFIELVKKNLANSKKESI